MARNNRGGRNNNPEGRNQHSNSWKDTAKDKPFTTAAAAAAAVGAGVFLWSRRNQISEQLSHLSDQISDWSENMRSSSSDAEFETTAAEQQSFMARPSRRGGRKSQSAIAEEALTLKETGAADTNPRG